MAHSSTPDDCGDHSAPSEFLAEFLSAIMSGQYAEALKYCRLILQYEPDNATARGFRPLLELRLLQAAERMDQDEDDASDATGASAPSRSDSCSGTGTGTGTGTVSNSGSASDDSDDNGNIVPRIVCAIK